MVIRSPEKKDPPILYGVIPTITSITNSSPYYLNLSTIQLENKTKKKKLKNELLSIEKPILEKLKKKEKVSDKVIKKYFAQHERLADVEKTTRTKMVDLSKKVIDSNDFFSTSKLELKLERLEQWLIDQKNKKIDLVLLDNKIEEFLGEKASKLIESKKYKKDRLKTTDSLIAVNLAEYHDLRIQDRLVQLIRIFGLIEKIATNDKSLEKIDKMENVLNAPVILPPEVFSLLSRQITKPLAFDKFLPNPENKKLREVAVKLHKLKIAYEDLNNIRKSDLILKTIESKTNRDSDESENPTTLDEFDIIEIEGSELIPMTSNKLILSGHATDKLKNQTKYILKEANFSLDDLNLAEAEAFIEKQMASLGKKVYSKSSTPFSSIEDFISFLDDTEQQNPTPPGMEFDFTPRNPFSVGIGELQKIRETILAYEGGEIAHIENVLSGEFKERTHRRLDRNEEFFSTEKESTEELEKELETTDRFELQKTVEEVIKSDSKINTAVDIKAYGPYFEVNWNLGYEKSNSKKESKRTSSEFAQDITQKAVKKIQERIKEQKTRKIVREIEEVNKHGIDNNDGKNKSGIYQWINKVYKVELRNYGIREILNFTVPEPSKFFKYAFHENTVDIEIPAPPRIRIKMPSGTNGTAPLQPNYIDIDNYLDLASKYNVEVEPPPPLHSVISETFHRSQQEGAENDKESKDKPYEAKSIVIPDGLKAETATVRTFTKGFGSKPVTGTSGIYRRVPIAQILLGSVTYDDNPKPAAGTSFEAQFSYKFRDEVIGPSTIPILLRSTLGHSYAASVEIYCERTENAFTKWQIKTFDAIMKGYLTLKQQFEEKRAAANIQEGIQITGKNPLKNRETEKTELKKLILSMLMENHFDWVGSMTSTSSQNYPEMNFKTANLQGKKISFLEQAIEWENMNYIFYPYFWGNKSGWVENLNIDEVDPLFEKFLTAGSARINVPIRPNFEDALNYFLETGKMWGGNDPPHIGDPLYLSVIDEIKKQHNVDDGDLIDTWCLTVPTSLTMIRDTLPDWRKNEEVDTDSDN